jgi:hypothetical protein
MTWFDCIVVLLVVGVCYDGYHNKFKTVNYYWALRRHAKLAMFGLAVLLMYFSLRASTSNSNDLIIHMYRAMGGTAAVPWTSARMRDIAPVVDFTGFGCGRARDPAPMPASGPPSAVSGGAPRPTKRCVSETKKKFVAARQRWVCDSCKRTLTHTYEIDHRVRLEHGGSNDVDNLVALCRECHGQKTALENM